MIGFIARRLVAAAVTAVVALTAMFGLLHASPASPVNALAPAVAANEEARQAHQARLGLDDPVVVQYSRYMGGLVRGDLGESLYDGSSVASSIARAAPASIELGILATVMAVIPGAALGFLGARRPGGAIDALTRVVTVAAISVPAYWLAVLALVVVGERAPDLLPDSGAFVTITEDPLTNLRVMIIPAIVLGLGGAAMVARALRTALVETATRDDVRFARSMGMSEGDILRKVALRHIAPTSVTVMALVVAGLMSGTVLVENVFKIPGLGHLMVLAFIRGDYPLALGTTLFTAMIFLGLNLVADVVVSLLDPRIRGVRPLTQSVSAEVRS